MSWRRGDGDETATAGASRRPHAFPGGAGRPGPGPQSARRVHGRPARADGAGSPAGGGPSPRPAGAGRGRRRCVPLTSEDDPLAALDTDRAFERWRVKAETNVERWGEQSVETLVLAATEELGELSRAHLEARDEDGDPDRLLDEIDDLAALCVQLRAAARTEAKDEDR